MVMIDLSLGILHVVVVGLVIVMFCRAGRSRVVREVRSVQWLVAGFALLLLAAVMHIVACIGLPNGSLAFCGLALLPLLERAFSLAGFVLLAVGFQGWLPGIVGQQQTETKLRDALDKVEQQARQRAIETARVKDEAETACAMKSRFLANLSHDLRNPLNGIIGFADILADMDIGEEPLRFVRVIKSSTDSLLQIVDDLHDFSKLEGGKLVFQEADFYLRETLAGIHERLQPEAAGKSLTLQWHIGEDVPDALRGDPVRLAQVVENLVANGIKFTDEGKVCFRVVMDESEGDGVQLHFTVSDTGSGVAVALRETLFEAYNSAENRRHRQPGTTGLGLAICSRLVRMMGGTIWFEENSEAERGSIFQFTARFGDAVGESAENPAGGMSASVGRRILLAEDDPVNQMLTTRILNWQGWDVTCVDDGRKVLAALAEQSYDLILMDVQMPNMNGIEATAAIRAAEQEHGGHCKIIALTANAMPGDREECMDAGMDGYIKKPFKAEELVAVVERHLA